MDQQKMRQAYEKQQTHEGREALRVRKELAQRFSVVLNRPMKVGLISALRDGETGEIARYFIAE